MQSRSLAEKDPADNRSHIRSAMPPTPTLALCGLAAAMEAATAGSGKPHMRVRVRAPINGAAVPRNFVGFSNEVHATTQILGDVPATPRRPYMQLLANLQNTSSGESTNMVLRVGGNSADNSCWDTANLSAACRYNYTQRDLDTYEAFAAAAATGYEINVSFVVGTNLGGLDNPVPESGEVSAIARAGLFSSGVVGAVEIGNEVDSYIATHPGSHLSWTWQYDKAFGRYVKAYHNAGLPAKRVQGGAFASVFRPDFDAFIPEYVKKYQTDLRTLSIHCYPTNKCKIIGKGDKTVALSHILRREASAGVAALYAPFVEAAASDEIPVVLGETNSVACGGESNVSDVFGSALWAVDFLAEMSKVGVQGASFHGSGSSYAPIEFNISAGPNAPPDVRPLYYGLLAFSQLTAGGASWLDADVALEDWGVAQPYSFAHAASSPGGGVRVAVVLKDLDGAAASGTVNVTVEVGAESCGGASRIPAAEATVSSLVPGLDGMRSRYGVTWEGRTFDGSPDGLPVGNRTVDQIQGTPNGQDHSTTFMFQVQAPSLAILYVQCE